ncbi:MAG: PEP-CTERM sorting domain-containing protein [Phycisphaeraceae bacterium]
MLYDAQRRLVTAQLAIGLAVSLAPGTDVTASPADWSKAVLLQTQGGVVNPGVLVGFNPQPEPPAYTGQTLFSVVDGVAQFTITDITNPDVGFQNFQFLFGVAGADGVAWSVDYPPDPINDFNIAFTRPGTTGLIGYHALIDVQSTSGGIMSPDSAVAFNPQPEPPAFGDGAFDTYGLDFGINSLSDVTLTVSITDLAGNAVDLVVVPEPATLGTLGAMLMGITMRRRGRPPAHRARN